MAYRLPTFNLLCNITTMDFPHEPAVPHPPFRIVNQACQLTYGRRVNVVSTGGTAQAGVLVVSMSLLLPPLVDIRGPQDVTSPDMVECPAGTGRWYWVAAVDDIGKGFTNEHRFAALYALVSRWTPPYL